MLQSQSLPNDTNVVNADQKTIAPNIVDQEQQLNNAQKSRLDKAVNRLSMRGTILQICLTFSSAAVELNYGIKYMNQCPIQPLINVFLIVHGCWSLVNGMVLLMGFITAKHVKRSPNPSRCARRSIAGSLIGQLVLLVICIAWLVVGQVWVFGAQVNGFQSSNSTQTATYCHPTVFWTGFVIIIITYAVWLIIILVLVVRYIIKRHKIKQGIAPNERS